MPAAFRVDASSAKQRIRRARAVAKAPMAGGRGKEMVSAMRRRTADGMRAHRHVRKGGGSSRWAKRAGGRWPASEPWLRAMLTAWGGGAGGGSFVEKARAGIYVTMRWAVVHTGGAGLNRLERRETRIRVTDRMRRFLAAAFGIFLRAAKKFIVLPARPHAAATPELHRDCAAIVRRDL